MDGRKRKHSTKLFKEEKPGLPTGVIVVNVKKLINRMTKHRQNWGKDLTGIFDLLGKLFPSFSAVMQNEEKDREPFKVNYKVFLKGVTAKSSLDKAENDYTKSIVEHEKKMAELERQRAQYHEAIEEAHDKQTVTKVNLLVDENEIHRSIQDERASIADQMDALTCYQRCCCFVPPEIETQRKRIAALRLEGENIKDRNNPEIVARSVMILERKRDEVVAQLAQLIKLRPENNNQGLARNYAADAADIDLEEAKHYHRLSYDAMLFCLRIYGLIAKMQSASISEQAERVTEKTALVDPSQVLFDKYGRDLKSKFDKFTCPEAGNVSFQELYLLFRSKKIFTTAERDLVLNGQATNDLLSKLVKRKESSRELRVN